MNQSIEFECADVAATMRLGEAMGRGLRGGEAIELRSDIGGGKTTFTKGLAIGMGIEEVVQSPTFTISQVHEAPGGRELHHFDFYRLSDAGIMRHTLSETLAQPNVVTVVEWGDIVYDILPEQRLSVTISLTGEAARHIRITCAPAYSYIYEALCRFNEQGNL